MPSAAHREQDFELRRYLTVLRRRKFSVLLCLLITIGAAVGLSAAQGKVYQASGKILLSSTTSDQLADVFGNTGGDVSDRVATEIEVMQSQTIRTAVSQALGRSYDVHLTSIAATSVVQVKATSSSPGEAARTVNVFCKTYIATRQGLVVDSLTSRAAGIQKSLDQLSIQLDDVNRKVRAIEDLIAALPTEIPGQISPTRQLLLTRRDAEELDAAPKRNAIQAQLLSKQSELDQITQALSLSETGGFQVVSPATTPRSPISPKPIRNGILAAIVGLVLGIALALLREQFDDALRTKNELEELMGGRPVLGLIPVVSGWRDRATTQVVSRSQPSSPAAEAYRTLRTSVQFLGIDRPIRKLQVTSPSAGEGKTTTVANLGVALARAGQRVAIVCCDLRRPRVESFFDLPMTPGFTSIMLGDVAVMDAIQAVPGESRLFLLASGPPPPNPSELLSTKRAHQVLDEVAEGFDIVLIDAPPVLPVTDALLLAHMVDATIIVASADRTSRRAVRRAVEMLEQVDARIEGSVLNGATNGESYGLGYGYGYEYGPYASDGSPGAASSSERRRRSKRSESDRPVNPVP